MEVFREITTAITVYFLVLAPTFAGFALYLKRRAGLQIAQYQTGVLSALAWTIWTLAEFILPLRWPYISATPMYFLASVFLFFAALLVWGTAVKTSPSGAKVEDYPVILVFAVWLANFLIAPIVTYTWAFSQALD